MVVLIEELCKLWRRLYIGCAAQFLASEEISELEIYERIWEF